jgi:SAM-dependent methyltransferase
MTIRVDPENNEIRTLLELADFRGQLVLEIGCGDGRLTWRYAGRAEHVMAIDPFAASIARAGVGSVCGGRTARRKCFNFHAPGSTALRCVSGLS